MTTHLLGDYINYSYITDTGSTSPVKKVSIGGLLGYNTQVYANLISADETIADLMMEIVTIQRLVSEARVDGMATKVDDITIDFNSHIARLKIEGSQKVQVLAQMVGLPIQVNIFTGMAPRSGFTPYQVKSTPYI